MTGNNDTAVAFAPLRRPAPIKSSHLMTGALSVVIIERREKIKKSTLAASTLACYVFICTNLEQTRNTRPISQFTMAGTLQVAKLWHAGF